MLCPLASRGDGRCEALGTTVPAPIAAAALLWTMPRHSASAGFPGRARAAPVYGFLTVPCFRLRRLVASTSLTRSHRNGPRWRAGSRKYVARVGTNRRAAYGSLAADIVEPIEVRIGQERGAGCRRDAKVGLWRAQPPGLRRDCLSFRSRAGGVRALRQARQCRPAQRRFRRDRGRRRALAYRSHATRGHRRQGVGYGRAGRRARALYGGRLAQPAATTPSTRGSACAFDRWPGQPAGDERSYSAAPPRATASSIASASSAIAWQ